MDELAGETVALLSGKKPRGRAFGRQIAFNVIPQVDALDPDGASREERRLWQETGRVLGLPQLPINATAVRVPVFLRPQPGGPCDLRAPRESGRRQGGIAARQGPEHH